MDVFVEKKVLGVGNVDGFDALEMLTFRGFVRDVGNPVIDDVSTGNFLANI